MELCPICQHDLGDAAQQLRCGHRYHAECVTQLRVQGSLGEACPVCRRSLPDQLRSVSGLHEDAQYLQLSALLRADRSSEALSASEACLREALCLDPSSISVRKTLAMQLLQSRPARLEEAEGHLEAARHIDPQDAEAQLLSGHAAFMAGNPFDAADYYTTASQLAIASRDEEIMQHTVLAMSITLLQASRLLPTCDAVGGAASGSSTSDRCQ
eukprot:TRINITY_DN104802_c0_g1_i1.p1 TRINITY_DN104802_c0_g1~~TRINITY_DN104802_c0_g1_i1.p1  ORF type:complete len:213 (+),score=44.02 TRINITY_DN104802_c0_g1_i1:43-681(+)